MNVSRALSALSHWRSFAVSETAPEQDFDGTDRRAIALLVAWSAVVFVAVAIVMIREAQTLAFPVARILFEDQFLNLGFDGRVLPHEAQPITPAFAVIFMGPVFWIHQMIYFALVDAIGSAYAITVVRLNELFFYLLGTPLLYRLLRYGKADRRVAFVLAMAYAVSPFSLTRIMVCTSLPTAQFVLLSELARIQGRPFVRALGLIAATFSYPLAGFSAVILAFQDYWMSSGPLQRTRFRILFATAFALAIVHFGILVLWPYAQPRLTFQAVTFVDNLGYPVFPYRLPYLLAEPVKLFEIAVFMVGSCFYLLINPSLWLPVIVDLVYFAGTNKGVRDHSMCLTTVATFAVIGVRAGLYRGGDRRRNNALIGGALFAVVYGHVMAGPHGIIDLARAPDPPRPHLEDVARCVPPGQKRCVVFPDMYAAFVGHCEDVTMYEPNDLLSLDIDDSDTAVFVAPTRLEPNPKGRLYGPPGSTEKILSGLADKIGAGQLHASVCPPWFVLVRSADSGPNDPAATQLLDPNHR